MCRAALEMQSVGDAYPVTLFHTGVLGVPKSHTYDETDVNRIYRKTLTYVTPCSLSCAVVGVKVILNVVVSSMDAASSRSGSGTKEVPAMVLVAACLLLCRRAAACCRPLSASGWAVGLLA